MNNLLIAGYISDKRSKKYREINIGSKEEILITDNDKTRRNKYGY